MILLVILCSKTVFSSDKCLYLIKKSIFLLIAIFAQGTLEWHVQGRCILHHKTGWTKHSTIDVLLSFFLNRQPNLNISPIVHSIKDDLNTFVKLRGTP